MNRIITLILVLILYPQWSMAGSGSLSGNMWFSPSTIYEGEESTLRWGSNADYCIWQGQQVPASGSAPGFKTAMTTSAKCYDQDGASITRSATLKVIARPKPTVSFSVSPSAVSYGGSSTVTWSSSEATSCSGANGISGTSGSKVFSNLTKNTSVSITCTGDGGSTTPSPKTIKVKPKVTFSRSPSQVGYLGSSTVTWSSNYATSCSGTNGISGTSGSKVFSNLTKNTSVSITCSGAGGSTTPSSKTIKVMPRITVIKSPATVDYKGSSTVSWSSNYATSCTGSDGISGTSGSKTYSNLTSDKSISITCSGAGGSETMSTTVKVNPPLEPVVSIGFTPSQVDYKSSATVTWSSNHAGSCTGTDGITGLSGSKTFSGLTENKTVSITCSGDGGSITRAATVQVNPPVPPKPPAEFNAPSVDIDGDYTLSWNASSSTVTHYKLYEGTELLYSGNNFSYKVVDNTDGNFEYRLYACDETLCGDYKIRYVNVVYGYIKKPGPLVVSGDSNNGALDTDGNYQVSWSGPHAYVEHYELEESYNGGPWHTISDNIETVVNLETQLSGNYAYRLKACGNDSCSGYSPEVDLAVKRNITPEREQPVLIVRLNYKNSEITSSDQEWAEKVFGTLEGQLNHYWAEVSKERFQFVPAPEALGIHNDGIATVRLPYDHTWTGDEDEYFSILVSEDYFIALDELDKDIDFSVYDTNNDGIVSQSELFIIVVVDSYSSQSLMPHQLSGKPRFVAATGGVSHSDGASLGTLRGLKRDGVDLDSDAFLDNVGNDWFQDRLAFIPDKGAHDPYNHGFHEWTSRIGVLAHESVHGIFTHNNRYIPDFYSYRDDVHEGVGYFGLMSDGSNGSKMNASRGEHDDHSGETPTHMTAWTKLKAGFIKEDEITVVNPGDGMENIELWGTGTGKHNIVKVNTERPNEYFLIENLAIIGYERGLGATMYPNTIGGIAIWHIDENKTGNNHDYHKLIDLEEAVEPMYTASGKRVHLYRSGDGYQTEFSDTTYPTTAELYPLTEGGSAKRSGLRVYNISKPGKVMTISIDYNQQ